MQDNTGKIYDEDKAVLLGENWSIFFGLPMSSSGHGIRDNAGVIKVKNRGGAWSSPIAESALQLGTISNSLSLLTLQVVTISGTVGLQTLQIGTISNSISTLQNGPQLLNNTFSASDFVGSGTMSWSVGSAGTTYKYAMLSNHLMHIQLTVYGADILDFADLELRVTLPEGKTLSTIINSIGWASDNALSIPIRVNGNAGNSHLSLQKLPNVEWTVGTASNAIGFQVNVPV